MAKWIICEYGCGTWITFRTEGFRSVAYESNGQQHRCLQQRAKKGKGKWVSRGWESVALGFVTSRLGGSIIVAILLVIIFFFVSHAMRPF
jgi:hypothetical protein